MREFFKFYLIKKSIIKSSDVNYLFIFFKNFLNLICVTPGFNSLLKSMHMNFLNDSRLLEIKEI